ncbi:unnamed protein product, partial [Symbiodinium pilosum]
RRPRDLAAGDRLVLRALEIIGNLRPRFWAMENPQTGLLKTRAFMQGLPYSDVPCTGIFLGPSKSGKTVAIISAILEQYRLYQVLVVIDDFADQPELHRRTGDGALDTLFIRGRHMQISTWVSSQKLRLISAAVRVNMQFICI